MPKPTRKEQRPYLRKNFIPFGIGLLILGVLLGFLLHPLAYPTKQESATSEKSISSAQPKSEPTYLAVLTAGLLKSTPLDQGKQLVSIGNVDPTMSWFTDRPERLSGKQPTNELLKAFFNSQPADPPNVTLAMTVGGGLQTRIVTLEDPEWDGKVLTFTSTPLEGDSLGMLPEQADQVSMTIDSIVIACNVILEPAPGWSLENISVVTHAGTYTGTGGMNYWDENAPGESFNWSGTMPYGCGGEVSADVYFGTEAVGTFSITFGMSYGTGTVWTLDVSRGIETQSNWSTVQGGATPIWWYRIGM